MRLLHRLSLARLLVCLQEVQQSARHWPSFYLVWDVCLVSWCFVALELLPICTDLEDNYVPQVQLMSIVEPVVRTLGMSIFLVRLTGTYIRQAFCYV